MDKLSADRAATGGQNASRACLVHYETVWAHFVSLSCLLNVLSTGYFVQFLFKWTNYLPIGQRQVDKMRPGHVLSRTKRVPVDKADPECFVHWVFCSVFVQMDKLSADRAATGGQNASRACFVQDKTRPTGQGRP